MKASKNEGLITANTELCGIKYNAHSHMVCPTRKKIEISTKDLFSKEGTDNLYMRIRSESQPWHSEAKIYWQQIYDQHYSFLDKNFIERLPGNDFFSCMWELVNVNYLASHVNQGVKLIRLNGKNSKPDFCFEYQDKRFFLEAVCAGPGIRPNLKIDFEKIKGKARERPVTEYKESLCASILEKGFHKYYGEKAGGYKCYMDKMEGESGFIIAISMAKIPCFNQVMNIYEDIGCLYGSTFEKSTNRAILEANYFTNDKFSHISAVLISYKWETFFPGFDHFYESCQWAGCRNDYILIHNPFAKTPLPQNVFSVTLEVDRS